MKHKNRLCQRKQCDNMASHNPVLRIPALGVAIPDHEPLAVRIAMPLCQHHAATVKPGEFLAKGSKLRARVLSACKATAKIKPDFKRSYIEVAPLEQSPKYTF